MSLLIWKYKDSGCLPCSLAGFPCSVVLSTSRERVGDVEQVGGLFLGRLTPLPQLNVWLCFQAMLTAAFLTWVTNKELYWLSRAESAVLGLGSLCHSTRVVGALAPYPCGALGLRHTRQFSNISSCENIFSRYIWQELPRTLRTDRKLIKCPEAQLCGHLFFPVPGSLWVWEIVIPYVSCEAFRMTLE